MKKLCALGLAVLLPSLAGAADQPKPTAWTRPVQPLESVERLDLPAVDEAGLKAEDERRFAETMEKVLRYAAPLPVDLTPESAGSWESLTGGELLWRLRIHSASAKSINLGFTEYFMPAGGRLFVYSLDGKHVYRPFTDADAVFQLVSVRTRSVSRSIHLMKYSASSSERCGASPTCT